MSYCTPGPISFFAAMGWTDLGRVKYGVRQLLLIHAKISALPVKNAPIDHDHRASLVLAQAR